MNNDIKDMISKYTELVNSIEFIKYEKEFSDRIKSYLNIEYEDGSDEPEMVRIVEQIINKIDNNPISFDNNSPFSISTRGVFIHSHANDPYQVEFNYYINKISKELGDLIFVLSIVHEGFKRVEKYTICQFKKGKPSKIFFDIDKEQLFLMSRFPEFNFKNNNTQNNTKKSYNLSNYSKCLGSYGLIYFPGDFAFVSAPVLDNFMVGKSRINGKDFFNLQLLGQRELRPNCIGPYYFYHFDDLHGLWSYQQFYNNLADSSLYANNIDDFVGKYLKGNIGEISYASSFTHIHKNEQADELLQDILNIARIQGESNFVDNIFNRFSYNGKDRGIKNDDAKKNDEESGNGGLGIIHTIINLNKEKKPKKY